MYELLTQHSDILEEPIVSAQSDGEDSGKGKGGNQGSGTQESQTGKQGGGQGGGGQEFFTNNRKQPVRYKDIETKGVVFHTVHSAQRVNAGHRKLKTDTKHAEEMIETPSLLTDVLLPNEPFVTVDETNVIEKEIKPVVEKPAETLTADTAVKIAPKKTAPAAQETDNQTAPKDISETVQKTVLETKPVLPQANASTQKENVAPSVGKETQKVSVPSDVGQATPEDKSVQIAEQPAPQPVKNTAEQKVVKNGAEDVPASKTPVAELVIKDVKAEQRPVLHFNQEAPKKIAVAEERPDLHVAENTVSALENNAVVQSQEVKPVMEQDKAAPVLQNNHAVENETVVIVDKKQNIAVAAPVQNVEVVTSEDVVTVTTTVQEEIIPETFELDNVTVDTEIETQEAVIRNLVPAPVAENNKPVFETAEATVRTLWQETSSAVSQQVPAEDKAVTQQVTLSVVADTVETEEFGFNIVNKSVQNPYVGPEHMDFLVEGINFTSAVKPDMYGPKVSFKDDWQSKIYDPMRLSA